MDVSQIARDTTRTLFEREQAIRTLDPDLANRIALRRAAIQAAPELLEAMLFDAGALQVVHGPVWEGDTFFGHAGEITALAGGPYRLASLGADDRLRIWDSEGQCLGDHVADGSGPLAGASQRGTFVFSREGEVVQVRDDQAVVRPRAPNDPIALFATGDGFVVGNADGQIARFGWEGDPIWVVDGPPLVQLGVTDQHVIVVAEEHEVHALALGDGASVEVPEPPDGLSNPRGVTWIEELHIAPDGRVAIRIADEVPNGIYGASYTWFLWNPLTNRRVEVDDPTPAVTLSGRTVTALPSGALRVVDDPDTSEPTPEHRAPVVDVAFHGEGWVSVDARDGELHLHDLTGAVVDRRGRHRKVAGLRSGERLVSWGPERGKHPVVPEVKVWSPALAKHTSIQAGSAYGDIALPSWDGTHVAVTEDRVLSIRTRRGPVTEDIKLPWQWDRRYGWSANNTELAVQLQGTGIVLWDLEDLQPVRLLSTLTLDSGTLCLSADHQTALVDWSFYQLNGVSLNGEAAGQLKDGLNVASMATPTGSLALVSTVQGKLHLVDMQASTQEVLDDAVGRHTDTDADADGFAWGGEGSVGCLDAEGAVVWRRALKKDETRISGVALQGGRLAALDADGILRVLDRTDGTELAHLDTGHEEGFVIVSHPDGGWLTGGKDGHVRHIDADGVLVGTVGPKRPAIYSLDAAADRLAVHTRIPDRVPGRQIELWDLDGTPRITLPYSIGPLHLLADGRRALARTRVFRLDRVDVKTGSTTTVPWLTWPGANALLPTPDGVLAAPGLTGRAVPGDRSGLIAWQDEEIWRVTGEFSQLWPHGDAVLAVRSGGGVVCVEPKTGEIRWEHPSAANCTVASDGVRAVLADSDGRLVIVDEGGGVLGQWAQDQPWTCCALRDDHVIAGDATGHTWMFALS